jgi:hypothetical protein
MTIFTLESAIARINELMADGYESKKIRACLILEDFPAKVISDAMKECSPKASPREGFKASYFKWLGDWPRSEAEAKEYILGNGEFGDTSPSVKRNLATNLNVWRLVNRVRSEHKDNVTGAPESDGQDSNSADVEQARAALRKAKSAWAKGTPPKNKNAFHPDKVSYLGDDALTKMYTEFFQDITG